MLRSIGLIAREPWIKVALLAAACLTFGAWEQAKATTFEVPDNGTLGLSGLTTPAEATFFVQWNNPYPNFDRADFGVGMLTASVNGAAFTIYDLLGTCPAPSCGPPSTVIDNVFGTHLGPGGESTFLISSPLLTILSDVSVILDNGADPIGPPGSYQIFVNLPAGISVTPAPSAVVLFATGLGGLVLFGWSRKRKGQTCAA